jgi:hypothetical protein
MGCSGERSDVRGRKLRQVWRRRHNEELHNIHVSPNVIRVIE